MTATAIAPVEGDGDLPYLSPAACGELFRPPLLRALSAAARAVLEDYRSAGLLKRTPFKPFKHQGWASVTWTLCGKRSIMRDARPHDLLGPRTHFTAHIDAVQASRKFWKHDGVGNADFDQGPHPLRDAKGSGSSLPVQMLWWEVEQRRLRWAREATRRQGASGIFDQVPLSPRPRRWHWVPKPKPEAKQLPLTLEGLCVIDFCDKVPRKKRRVCSRCEKWIERRRRVLQEADVPVPSMEQLRADCAVFLRQEYEEDARLRMKQASDKEFLASPFKVGDYLIDETERYGDIDMLIREIVHSDDFDEEERAETLDWLLERWWERLMRPDNVATRKRTTLNWDRGTVGQRMYGGKDSGGPVPMIAGHTVTQGIGSTKGSRATTKRWLRSGLVRIRHRHTFIDDPESFNPTAVPLWRRLTGSSGRSFFDADGNRVFLKNTDGWRSKRYPPASIYVPLDCDGRPEAATSLWGIGQVDYTAIVWRDLQSRTTVTLYMEGHLQRRAASSKTHQKR